jgi:hypothetical protein
LRLVVDGIAQDQRLTVRMDPRVQTSEEGIRLQTDASLACYKKYNELQAVREEIDKRLAETGRKWPKGRKELVTALRGNGTPENPDIMYGAIYAVPVERETLVALQDKWLQLLALLQSADEAPTQMMMQALDQLTATHAAVLARWDKLK